MSGPLVQAGNGPGCGGHSKRRLPRPGATGRELAWVALSCASRTNLQGDSGNRDEVGGRVNFIEDADGGVLG